MLFRGFSQRRQRERAAAALYLAAVEQARRPEFYARFAVPDTLEGRYDMIILHVWMVLRRTSVAAGELARAMVELMFDDMDRNLREMGVTDLRVGKRVLNMAEAFYGRVAAYDKALAEGDAALADALRRNLYQSGDGVDEVPLAAMAAYVRAQICDLDSQGVEALCQGRVTFLSPEVKA